MITSGVDYDFNPPTIQSLMDSGKTFAARYVGLGSTDKRLTPDEARALTEAGVSIVAVCEGTTDFMLGGAGAGHDAALRALGDASRCGMPADRPIYFACDFNVSSGQWPAIAAFLDGAAGVLGRRGVGIYGGTNALMWARNSAKALWYWQALGWQNGVQLDWAHLRQVRNGVPFGGGTVDLDIAQTIDYGQWRVGNVTTLNLGDVISAMADGTTKDGYFWDIDPINGPHLKDHTIADVLAKLATSTVDVQALSTAILNGLDYDRLARAIAAQMTQRPLSVSLSGTMTGNATPQGA